MNKTTHAFKLAEEALVKANHFQDCEDALVAVREVLAEQSIVLNDPHPPHRLCECTACLEYWTPLPDCDAFAASDKPIADTVKTYEQGYLDGYDAGLIFANSRVEPVKQEPVAILKSSKANFERQFGKQVFADWVYDDLTYSFESAAPVSAEAIRAEALEEAAKVCEKAMIQMNYSEAPYKQCAAAIRGLK